MKKFYNRITSSGLCAIVSCIVLAFTAMPIEAVGQSIDLNLTNVTVREAVETLNKQENYSIIINF